ncbi:hypothetical protein AAHA92_02920 [Salvia divinorum]|uniref:Uncharacterized protein n=1 Tax=Salvia divinorum TaxID=28513 RepID=A0ABD1IFE7_SALDI
MSHSKGFIPLGASTQRTPVADQYRRNSYRKCDRSRRCWSDKEEEALIVVLKELVTLWWKSDNDFHSGVVGFNEHGDFKLDCSDDQ